MTVKTPAVHAIATGGTSQIAAERNRARKYLLLQNTSAGDLWYNYDKDASAASPSILLVAGEAIHFPAGTAPINAIYIFGATTGQSYSLWQA